MMFARTWHGAVPTGKSDEYLDLLRAGPGGLGDYEKTPGNRGAYVLRRTEGDVTHFLMVSFWESLESIKGYTGDDIGVPQYTASDPDYLIELEPTVQHHEVFEHA